MNHINCIAFNEDSSLFTVAHARGFKVFNADPVDAWVARDFGPSGGLSRATVLERTNYVVMVGSGPELPPTKIVVWNDQSQQASAIELEKPVLNVLVNRDVIVAVLDTAVYIHSLAPPHTLRLKLATAPNPRGLAALCDGVLVVPARESGQVALVELAPEANESNELSSGHIASESPHNSVHEGAPDNAEASTHESNAKSLQSSTHGSSHHSAAQSSLNNSIYESVHDTTPSQSQLLSMQSSAHESTHSSVKGEPSLEEYLNRLMRSAQLDSPQHGDAAINTSSRRTSEHESRGSDSANEISGEEAIMKIIEQSANAIRPEDPNSTKSSNATEAAETGGSVEASVCAETSDAAGTTTATETAEPTEETAEPSEGSDGNGDAAANATTESADEGSPSDPTPRVVDIVACHRGALAAIAINRRYLATASLTGTLIRCYDRETRESRLFRRGLDKAHIHSLALSPDSQRLAVLSDKKTLHIFELAARPPPPPKKSAVGLLRGAAARGSAAARNTLAARTGGAKNSAPKDGDAPQDGETPKDGDAAKDGDAPEGSKVAKDNESVTTKDSKAASTSKAKGSGTNERHALAAVAPNLYFGDEWSSARLKTRSKEPGVLAWTSKDAMVIVRPGESQWEKYVMIGKTLMAEAWRNIR